MVRLSVIFCITVYSLCSCTVLFYGHQSEPKKKLPSLHTKDYGSIEYVDSVTEEKAWLTRFWAQEAVFAPESRELLQDMGQQGFRFSTSEVGVIDSHFYKDGMRNTNIDATALSSCEACTDTSGGHGTKVSSLITGKSPVGVSSKGKIIELIDKNSPNLEFFVPGYGIDNPPPVINASIGLGGQYSVDNSTDILRKTIFVTSAGNDFPAPVETIIEDLGNKMIVVGSLDPSGFVSDFSQSHQHVAVLAPSDNFITALGANGKFSTFGGTSGATPLVSGAIADLRSILPDLTRDEVATIVAKTATPTSINMVSHHNGGGTLNQYKMLRVGQRLSESGWPHNRANLIDSEKMYDFADEAQKLSDEAEVLLKTGNEVDYETGFKKLRTAFALDTSNTKTRTILADIYQNAGYSVQALFYKVPEQSVQHTSIIKKTVHRTHELMSASYLDVMRDIITWEKVSDFEKKYVKDYFQTIFENNFENKTNPALRGDPQSIIAREAAFPSLAAVENSPQQRLLIAIDTLSSSHVYGYVETQTQILNLLIEYARDTHPELMAEPTIQKAITKYKLSETSRLKHRIYSFADYITKSIWNESSIDKYEVWQQELREALQAAENQPGLLDNDRIIDDYAKQKSMSVADLWKKLRKLAKLVP